MPEAKTLGATPMGEEEERGPMPRARTMCGAWTTTPRLWSRRKGRRRPEGGEGVGGWGLSKGVRAIGLWFLRLCWWRLKGCFKLRYFLVHLFIFRFFFWVVGKCEGMNDTYVEFWIFVFCNWGKLNFKEWWLWWFVNGVEVTEAFPQTVVLLLLWSFVFGWWNCGKMNEIVSFRVFIFLGFGDWRKLNYKEKWGE